MGTEAVRAALDRAMRSPGGGRSAGVARTCSRRIKQTGRQPLLDHEPPPTVPPRGQWRFLFGAVVPHDERQVRPFHEIVTNVWTGREVR